MEQDHQDSQENSQEEYLYRCLEEEISLEDLTEEEESDDDNGYSLYRNYLKKLIPTY